MKSTRLSVRLGALISFALLAGLVTSYPKFAAREEWGMLLYWVSLGAALLSGCKNVSPVTIQPDGSLLCESWAWTLPPLNTLLESSKAPEKLTHVGIRAHSLRPGPGAVSLPCTVDWVIDNVFSDIVMLRTPGPNLLRMELPKEEKPLVAGTPITVHAAPEELLLLTNGE